MTNFGVLGTGSVGQTVGSKLTQLGHHVMLGSRDAHNDKATAWAASVGPAGSHGTFADAATFGDVIVNATAGSATPAALETAGAEHLDGKVILDISNSLDLSRGFPPSLSVPSTDSLGERIQRAFPAAKVVKALNTITANVMVEPSRVPGVHNTFVAGDDADAKAVVVELLASFGWAADVVIDVGGIASSRGLEAYVLFWVSLMGALGTAEFNIDVRRAMMGG